MTTSVSLADIYQRLVREGCWTPVTGSIDPAYYGVKRLSAIARAAGVATSYGWGGGPVVTEAGADQVYRYCVAAIEAEKASAMRAEMLATQEREVLAGQSVAGLVAYMGTEAFLAVQPLMASDVQIRRRQAGLPPEKAPERVLTARQKRLIAEELEKLDER